MSLYDVFNIHPDYQHCLEAADYILDNIGVQPGLCIILGSGLGPLAKMIEVDKVINYEDIPNFPVSTVSTHAGELITGRLAGVNVICMNGRFHYYEGYTFEDLAFPVRALALAGVKAFIITNASGAVNTDYHPGDVMIIKDHINLLGVNPVRGQQYADFGDRFYDTGNLYTKDFRKIAMECAEGSGLTVHEGVYMFFPGPNYETPAEIRAARILGADAVGMSTVPEALTAGHCGLPVLGLSVVTNMAAGILEQKLTDEEVNETGRKIEKEFSAYVVKIISETKKHAGDYDPTRLPVFRKLI